MQPELVGSATQESCNGLRSEAVGKAQIMARKLAITNKMWLAISTVWGASKWLINCSTTEVYIQVQELLYIVMDQQSRLRRNLLPSNACICCWKSLACSIQESWLYEDACKWIQSNALYISVQILMSSHAQSLLGNVNII